MATKSYSYDMACERLAKYFLGSECNQQDVQALSQSVQDAVEAFFAGPDAPCTDCGGTGICHQTERRCSCQPKDGGAEHEALISENIDLNARLGMSEGLKADTRARAHELLATLKSVLSVVDANVGRPTDTYLEVFKLRDAMRTAISKAGASL